ncbi:MAG: terpene cyclase/mutase family protein [Planctomycetaceae bacterium]|nr:terpene cyclase/mutase family protein [Planctomycetaceae bacterium]
MFSVTRLGCFVLILVSSTLARGDEPETQKFGVGSIAEDQIPDAMQEPVSAAELDAAIKRGINFLLTHQNEDGSWGSPTRTKGLNIYAPIPGAHHAFRMGTSALALSALIEMEPQFPECTDAINLAEAWMIEKLPYLRRADQTAIYNVWGHAYALQALARMHDRHKEDPEKLKQISDLIDQQFDMLTRYESVDGGWGYYDFRYGAQHPTSDSISFVGATVLVAFHEVAQRGYQPPENIRKRAIAAILRQEKNDGSFLYGEYLKDRPMHPVNRPGGSLGRSQACNIALRYWGNETITNPRIKEWLERLIVRNGWLDIGRKRPVPHEAWFSVAGYFYYYGHYYGSLCLQELPVSERAQYAYPLTRLMLERQEKDGSWWDYPLYDYHQPYGTGFALLTLNRYRIPATE